MNNGDLIVEINYCYIVVVIVVFLFQSKHGINLIIISSIQERSLINRLG